MREKLELGIVYSKLYRRGKYPSAAVNMAVTLVTKFNRYEFYMEDNIVLLFARKVFLFSYVHEK